MAEKGKADIFLKVSLAAAALLAGGGVGFYYGVYLPAQDVRRQTQELAAKQQAAADADRALHLKAQREQAAQQEYQACMDYAEASYRQRWTFACQAQHDADQAAYDDCADDLFSTQDGCLAKHPIRPVQDCPLPSQVAQNYSQARDVRKQECAARLQSAQGVGAGAVTASPVAGPVSGETGTL